MPTLANSPTGEILLWVGVLIVLAMAGGVLIMVLRRRILARDTAHNDAGLLDHLRRLVEDGEMSEEEFDLARRKMVQRAAEQRAERSQSPSDAPPS